MRNVILSLAVLLACSSLAAADDVPPIILADSSSLVTRVGGAVVPTSVYLPALPVDAEVGGAILVSVYVLYRSRQRRMV